MGWWEDLGNAASSVGNAASNVVDTVAEVVGEVVETAGDVVADLVETAGNAAQDGLNAAGQTPGLGWPLRGALAWFGGVVAGAGNLIGAVIKGVFGIVGGVASGLIRMIGGFLVLDFELVLKGEIDIGSSIAGAVILIGGAGLSLGQRVFGAQSNERSLTKAEKAMLSRVFLNSLSLYNIRLIEGSAGLFHINERAFTLGNTIYMKGNDVSIVPHILVHECVHVWQYQNLGSRYTMDALGAQAIHENAYDWEAELERGNSDWNDFNKEAQAQLIQNIWSDGTSTLRGETNEGEGSFFSSYGYEQSGPDIPTVEFIFNGTDYTDLAIAAVESLRGKINLRWSRAF